MSTFEEDPGIHGGKGIVVSAFVVCVAILVVGVIVCLTWCTTL